MDLVSSCKDKLAYFRIKELKDILTQLGLSKQGKKQDLVDRILAILADERVSGMWAKKNAVGKEEVAKLVDDTYRKMQVSGATDLASSKGQSASDCSNTKFKEEIEDSYPTDKTRCPCGSSLTTDSMIKCEDARCNVWQHIGCVIIPDKPMEGFLPHPEHFYCELCRLGRADPFWVTVAHPLNPVKLNVTNVPADGTSPVQSVEKTFQLTRADKDLLAKPEYDVQAWCILLNDKVLFRMQWPQYADLQVNGVPVRAINRPGSQLLGANGRDDGPIITPCTRDGINKISLSGCDARVFCLGVRIVKRRTVQHILNLIPKESDGELFEDALARVRRCVGGGTATENADSDSDLEVVSDSIPVNLRCPMSGSRMKVAGRFKPCAHMGCFDLEVFVEMNQRSRKWQCPICLKNYSLEHIIIDPYFNRITTKMRNCGEEVTDIEVKPDGSWRAKAESDRRGLGDLGLWHFPDSTICVTRDAADTNTKPEVLKQVKQECVSEGHIGLKLEIKKNRNGFWEFNKPKENTPSSGNRPRENFENPNVIPMSSSATGSGRDGEDPSVNQDGGGNFDFSTTNGAELDSISLNLDPAYVFADQNPAEPLGDAEVIVLSDSEEENETLIPAGPIYSGPPHGIPESYHEDPALGPVGNSCLGPFDTHEDDFEVPLWSLPSGSQGPPGFQLFGSDMDVSDALVDVQHGSINCPTSMSGGYTLTTAETGMVGSTSFIPEASLHHSNADMNNGLVDNPLAFGGDDPSLQIFLPTRPSDSAVQADLRHQPDMSNGIRTEDWISLRLGDGSSGGGHGGGGVPVESTVTNGMNLRQQLSSKEGALDNLADTGMFLRI
ncbi:hypothetical protein LguiB_000959 [Lonicera macranthoides]